MGIPPETVVIILGLSGLIYLVLGGMWATVFSDIVQFALFAIAFIGGTLWVVLARDGGTALSNVPAEFYNPCRTVASAASTGRWAVPSACSS